MMHWSNIGWGMGFGWIFMLIFWALIVAAIVLFVQGITKRTESHIRHDTPLDILKRRYAQGEISKEQYERMKDDFVKK